MEEVVEAVGLPCDRYALQEAVPLVSSQLHRNCSTFPVFSSKQEHLPKLIHEVATEGVEEVHLGFHPALLRLKPKLETSILQT